MYHTYKKISILILASVSIGFFVWFFVIHQEVKMSDILILPPPQQEKIPAVDYKSPPNPDVRAKDWSKIGIYHNQVGHYWINYPEGNFRIDADAEKDKIDLRGIEFWENSGSREIIIVTQPTTATSALQALMDVKDGKGRNEYIFEKMITIDKYPAAMGHLNWNGHEVQDVKMVYFIKDEELYMIYSEYIDHNRIWNSFKFE